MRKLFPSSEYFYFLVALLLISHPRFSRAQDQGSNLLGWEGEEIIPGEAFINTGSWVPNAQSGNSIFLIPNDSCLQLKWYLEGGNYRWVQAYTVFNPPISLSDQDVYALDIHGSSCQSEGPCHDHVSLEIKFENGARQAVFERRGEPGLLSVDRWIERLFFLRGSENFYIPAGFNWDSLTVFSIAIRSYPDYENVLSDSGIVSFRKFVGDHIGSWDRSLSPEHLEITGDTLKKIAGDAAAFILGRQETTGLLTTWEEDHSSWLYGQGLALKLLVLEGKWESNIPVNGYAMAAEKLARFLAEHQYGDGSWPRAWNSRTGSILYPYENDGTIWMGDFPFALMGLEAYLKKVCDTDVAAARDRAREFLLSLVEPDGRFYTVNKINGGREAVTSTEAYVAAIAALIETGDEHVANTMIQYIESRTWNDTFLSWDEGLYSDRVVLFANTWMANLLHERGFNQKAMDALSLVSRLLFTRGPGEPYGFDGIGPIAVWYEGTLSYINARGPGSNYLFRNIIPYINPDGSVPHYNDDIGARAAIWAEPWASLDGTSWLYFTAAGKSPFVPLERDTICDPVSRQVPETGSLQYRIFPNPATSSLHIRFPSGQDEKQELRIMDISGKVVSANTLYPKEGTAALYITDLSPGIYLLQIGSGSGLVSRKLVVRSGQE